MRTELQTAIFWKLHVRLYGDFDRKTSNTPKNATGSPENFEKANRLYRRIEPAFALALIMFLFDSFF